MKKIFLLLFFTSNIAFCQTIGHNHTNQLVKIYFNKDFSSFMTRTNKEIGLWNIIEKKPIWIIEAKKLGCDITDYWYMKPLPDFSSFTFFNDKGCNQLVNSKTLLFNSTKSAFWNFTESNNKSISIETIENKSVLYITDMKTSEKVEIFKDDLIQFFIFKNKIYVANGKKTKRYDITSNKWDNFSANIPYIPNTNVSASDELYISDGKAINLKTNSKIIEIPYRMRDAKANGYDLYKLWIDEGKIEKILFYNVLTNIFTEIPIQLKYKIEPNLINSFYGYQRDIKVFYIIEFQNEIINNINIKTNYLSSYSTETGIHIESILLTDNSLENTIASNKKHSEEINEKLATRNEENRINNLPENVLKRRFNLIKGRYFYNNLNKCIYLVDENSGLFEGDLVKMIAKHDDSKQEIDVYEHIDKIENTLNYKEIKSFGRCGICFGRGYISNTYKTTAADYEYTYGVKIIKSTTKTNSCNQCGGCGLNPK